MQKSIHCIPFWPIVSELASKNVFATLSVTYEFPIFPFPLSLPPFHLSPLYKLTYIPSFSSMSLKFSRFGIPRAHVLKFVFLLGFFLQHLE